MKTILVKNLMVPLSEYATVFDDATLSGAIDALEAAQFQFDKSRYRHRAILVCEKNTGKVIGKISQLDVIRALEPKYGLLGEKESFPRFGFSPQFMKSILDQYELWYEPLKDICRKAGKQKVIDVMYKLTPGEYVKEDSGLNQAVHQLVMGHHQSLLVSRGDEIVGILRLTDIFMEICAARKEESL
ncbi:MAG: CBS domain-containing protein [Proteobacteria bacterium]|nr:CBS domain-containing protein [Pseudomonadota bacterium]MBU1586167.1 CBS domain-containing protein [Pseudomonadota bacterium]MBU2454344.1 CBS domain-containing protein [Pseudomonadota bacterium]MBU2631930.1 CBS domain-containing protein [Pseudomonadota bacterium]